MKRSTIKRKSYERKREMIAIEDTNHILTIIEHNGACMRTRAQIKNNISSKLNSIQSKNNKDLVKFFKSSNSKAIIVRPDRFILSSCKSVKDFKSYLNKSLSILV